MSQVSLLPRLTWTRLAPDRCQEVQRSGFCFQILLSNKVTAETRESTSSGESCQLGSCEHLRRMLSHRPIIFEQYTSRRNAEDLFYFGDEVHNSAKEKM